MENIEAGPVHEPRVLSTGENAAIENQIRQVLEEYVKPAVEQDGGAIDFKSFENGVVTVTLRGSCSGCPSSTITLKAGIENLLKRMVPGVHEVVSEAM
jgi:NFU1 iron-sulfur cluster scaffold homolog, mitochondrial